MLVRKLEATIGDRFGQVFLGILVGVPSVRHIMSWKSRRNLEDKAIKPKLFKTPASDKFHCDHSSSSEEKTPMSAMDLRVSMNGLLQVGVG